MSRSSYQQFFQNSWTWFSKLILGLFAFPWFGVFVVYLILTSTVFFLEAQPDSLERQIYLSEVLTEEQDLGFVWQVVSYFLFLNYLLSFSLKRRYERLRPVFVLTSVFIIILFAIIIFPNYQAYLESPD